jgi:hypothetical protein
VLRCGQRIEYQQSHIPLYLRSRTTSAINAMKLDLATAKEVLAMLESCLKIAAIIVGSIWAYYKVIRGRLYKPRLEFSIAGKRIAHEGRAYISVALSLKNVGNSKVIIDPEKSGLRIYTCEHFENVVAPDVVEWTRLSTLAIFEERSGWIETNEAFQNQLLVSVPPEAIAIKLSARLVASKFEWWAETIISS